MSSSSWWRWCHRAPGDDHLVVLSCDVAFEAADGFPTGLALADAPLHVVAGAGGPAQTSQDDGAEGRVGLAVATAVEPSALGLAWRALPPCFGISKSTVHRRFLIWSRAGVWGRLHEAVLHRLDDAGLIDVSRVVLDFAHVRAKKRGRTHRSEPRGPGQAGFQDARPVGRERTAPGRRRLGRQHPRQRGAEAHGRGSPNETRPHRGRHFKPQRLHADKAYDIPHLRK